MVRVRARVQIPITLAIVIGAACAGGDGAPAPARVAEPPAPPPPPPPAPVATRLVVSTGYWGGLVPGVTLPLEYRVLDAAGQPLAGLPAPQFVSRRPEVVRVDSTGRVTGIRGGSAVVVATLGAGGAVLADSVRVSVFCTLASVPALHVTVRDSASGRPAASGATIVVRQGETVVDSVSVAAGYPELDGLAYTVRDVGGDLGLTVRKPGYRDWTRVVHVPSDGCHPILVSVTVRLARES
jgi:hypothetical protein